MIIALCVMAIERLTDTQRTGKEQRAAFCVFDLGNRQRLIFCCLGGWIPSVCLSVCVPSNVRPMDRRQSAHQHTNTTREKNQTDYDMQVLRNINQDVCEGMHTSTPRRSAKGNNHCLIWWDG
uniref:Uncharacterized protein n=1 Tax=Vitrella brassicaformis TaxID=1169539 RepID=A0A7S1KGK6_9ALVE|mmetsp:Transcript_53360/g.134373  ORF Transcript_53360/g.134373 Transcript_53360/m.134373 type:complete len:122 (+) Transcript_53360:232-597(+)